MCDMELKKVDKKVEDIKSNNNIYSVGKVIKVNPYTVIVSGLNDITYYEEVDIAGKAKGFVFAVGKNTITVSLVDVNDKINPGDEVYSLKKQFKCLFSMDSMGKVIDIFGNDLIAGKKFDNLVEVPIENEPIPIMDRGLVTREFLTGLTSIDMLYPIGRGQRQLIIGDKKTGKTQIALDAIVNQKDKNMVCIYVALSIAESMMMDSYDVLVVIDDLKKHADVYRQISLASKKTPGRDAYPSDIFYAHSKLLEKGCQHKNGGSITILPIVETKSSDITDYISTNIISICDGQIVLSSKNFAKGEKPALDYGLSVSRLGGAVQSPEVKRLGSLVRGKLLEYLEVRDIYELANIDEMSEELQHRMKEGKVILDKLKQNKFSPKSKEEMLDLYKFLEEGDNNENR